MARVGKLSRYAVAGLFLGLALPHGASAQPTAFTYQGRLKNGASPANGLHDFQFKLFNASTGGAQQGGTLTFDGVGANPPPITVSGGLFTVALDFGNQFPGAPRYLEVAVRPHGLGSYTTLIPRQALTPTPYAVFSEAPWTTSGTNISYTGGNVGIGTSTPGSPLDVNGDARLHGRIAAGGDGVFGPFDAYYDGFFNFSQTIQDFSSRPGWEPFESFINLDPNVDLTGANRKEIYTWDFEAEIPATNTHDIYYVQGPYCGAFTYGSGTITYLSGGNIGAESFGSGTTQFQAGAYFFGLGAYLGTSTIVDNHGVDIWSGHNGVAGSITRDSSLYIYSPYHDRPMDNHYGIYLEDQNFGTNDSYSIYSAGGKSYFNGDVTVVGTLSKGAGSFKIDHPLDPENKFLYHSFVESPDMLNIYNGSVTTDENGYAEVALPQWFEALNRDFRYQLTVVDEADSADFVQAKVVRKIQNNRFGIRTSAPLVEVSWQVTGIRHDAYAEAHRIPVEEEKPAYARGAYLHPLEHGQPAERGLEAAHRETVGLNAVPPRPPGRPVRAHGS